PFGLGRTAPTAGRTDVGFVHRPDVEERWFVEIDLRHGGLLCVRLPSSVCAPEAARASDTPVPGTAYHPALSPRSGCEVLGCVEHVAAGGLQADLRRQQTR